MRKPLIFLIVLLSSCSTYDRHFTSATYGTVKSYIAQPEYNGEKEWATYLSGDLAFEELDYFGSVDTKTLVSLNATGAYTHKNFNFHYGLGASYGSYKFEAPVYDNISMGERKDFYSLNLLTGINFLWSTPKVDYRILGIEAIYNNIAGSYPNTLNIISGADQDQNIANFGYNVLAENQNSLFSFNLNTEFVFKLKGKNTLSTGLYISKLFLKDEVIPDYLYGAFFSYRYSKYTFSLMNENNFDQNYNPETSAIKFGLAYRLF